MKPIPVDRRNPLPTQPGTAHGAVGRLHVGAGRVIRLKHPGRWLACLVIAVLFAMAVNAVLTNPRFGWSVVGDYLFAAPILAGIRITVVLTIIGMGVGILFGIVLALMRLSENPILRGAAFAYIWLFRGVPLLVQLIFWYNIAALFPVVSFGIPFGPSFASIHSNSFMTAFVAAMLGLALNEAAYMAEIIRGGLLAVDEGQYEACSALGVGRLRAVRSIILPQAMRAILPPTGNEVITMLKTTSLVSVVAVADLLYATQLIYARTFQTIPMLVMASLWYLAMTSVLSVGQYFLERHYGRGSRRSQPTSMWSNLAGSLVRLKRQRVSTPSEIPTSDSGTR